MKIANTKKAKKTRLSWLPPKGAGAFFSPASDDAYKRAHPIGYKFLLALGFLALFGPSVLWFTLLILSGARLDGTAAWSYVGWLGAFIVGIGLFNFVAILIRQYLGHLLSLLCFVIGGGLVGLSLAFLL